MRQGPNGRRPRGRHHNSGGGNNGNGGGGGGNPQSMNRPRSAASLRHQSFDSNCGDLRVRGNAWQVYEKYQALARDATSAGDRVAAENFLQHAEHYYRIIEAINEATAAEQIQRGPAYTGQPEVPTNYYAPNAAQPSTEQPSGNPPPQGGTPVQPPMAQAEVVQTRVQGSALYTQEEIDEHNRVPPSAASR